MPKSLFLTPVACLEKERNWGKHRQSVNRPWWYSTLISYYLEVECLPLLRKNANILKSQHIYSWPLKHVSQFVPISASLWCAWLKVFFFPQADCTELLHIPSTLTTRKYLRDFLKFIYLHDWKTNYFLFWGCTSNFVYRTRTEYRCSNQSAYG